MRRWILPLLLSLSSLTPAFAANHAFAQNYQANYGTIPLPGCGPQEIVYDPFLLNWWVNDKPCFEQAMQKHMDHGDNVVWVSPRSEYRDDVPVVDLWHDPLTFRLFLLDIQSHVNKYGEHIQSQVFLAADGHIPSFLKDSVEGSPDDAAESHWEADVRSLAASDADLIPATVECWECRHQRDYMTPGTYERLGRIIAAVFPDAEHFEHLIPESSAWASWNCDPDGPQDPDPAKRCTAENAHMEGDDPVRGSEPGSWERCVEQGWCDGFLYQFEAGQRYLYPDSYPNLNADGSVYVAPGALGRYEEICDRLGNDAGCQSTSGGDHHGWRYQIDLIAGEFIFDTYHKTNAIATEDYAVDFCKRALAIGGLGCGSASYRAHPPPVVPPPVITPTPPEPPIEVPVPPTQGKGDPWWFVAAGVLLALLGISLGAFH